MKNIKNYENFLGERAWNEKKPGRDPYHRGLSDEEIEDKEKQAKKQAKMDDDDPNAYKEMPGDKEAREKGKVKTSKHVKKYHELYGDDKNEALSDHEDDSVDYDELYKDYPYKDKKGRRRRRRNESVVTEASENAYMLSRLAGGIGQEEAEEFLKDHDLNLIVVSNAVRNGKVNKYDLRDVIQGKAARSIEKKVMKAITESLNEKAEGDRSKLDASAEKGLKKKSDETGVPIGLLRIVYRRGMAAWKTGHRPGAGQQQWAYARVNSFLTKQPGTWGGADKDVAKEVRDGGHDKKLKKG